MDNVLTSSTPSSTPHKGLHIGLWVTQGLLAAAFLMAGLMKLTTPSEALAAQGMTWVHSVPAFVPVFAGAVEMLGAIGLILPSLLRIQPKLTVYAAAGLLVTMAVAVGLHLALGELHALAPPIVLAALAAFVVWGRSKKAVIAPR